MSKKSSTTAEVIEAAEEHLQRAYARGSAATADLRIKRAALSQAIMNWQSHFRVTPEQAVRAHLARQAEHAAKVRAGAIVEHRAPEVAPTWPIQIALMAGKSPNANTNLRRPRAFLMKR
jgi:hypothetical protein